MNWASPLSFGVDTAGSLALPGLAGSGALAGAGGAAATGLGAALGPIGWAGLGMQALGTVGSLFGGASAAEEAKKQMEEQRRYAAGSSMYAQQFPRYLDWRDAKREIALSNSPAFRQSEAFEARQDTFPAMAGKYGPAFARRFGGSYYG